MPSTSNAALGLLYVFNGSATARWNFPETVGDHWNSGAGIGDDVALKFSFLSGVPSYYGGVAGFQTFSTAQKEATREVLQSIEEMVGVNFTETSGPGQLTFGNSSQQQGQGGFAYSPNFSYMYSGSEVTSVTENKAAGDVWMNRNESWDANAWKPGGDGYLTLLHEVGHALGLKHPFEGSYRVMSALDNERYTVMSYTQAAKTTLIEVTGNSGHYSWQQSWLRPSTLMLMDIDALQSLYGANTATRSGSTTYKWGTNEELLETIWDGGGKDTIDCSNQVFSNVINLEGATYSSIALRQTASEIRSGLELPSWFTNALPFNTYDGSNNLAIARGVVIENAIGGSARDIINGNAAGNTLLGNAGNDTLSGGAGDDTLNGGTGIDSMTGGSGNDTYYVDSSSDAVRESGSGGSDLVLSYLTSHTLGSHVEAGRVLAGGTASLSGNSLDNVLYAGNGSNVLAGGSGTDTVSYEYGASRGVAVSLAQTAAQATLGSGSDQLSSIESLFGSGYADSLAGNAGNNVLAGGGGNDTLSGGSGNDRLIGGEGRDLLTGGGGKDIFDFDSVAETGTSSSSWDIVADFARGQDDIDLSSIDAKIGTAANDAFSFIGSSDFSESGQLRYVWSAAKHYGVLYGNTDSDGAAEFAIQVAGVSHLSASDFIA